MHDGKIFLLGLFFDFSQIVYFDTRDNSINRRQSRGHVKEDDGGQLFPANPSSAKFRAGHIKFAGVIGQGETYRTAISAADES